MKKTLNINLGGVPFIIDEDACEVLKNYLDDIASRLAEPDREIIGDVEARMAEIFRNELSLRAQVVDLAMVNRAIAVMGRPEEFGEKKRIDEIRSACPPPRPRKLYRNMDDKIIGGVCSGIADYLGVDATLIRIITVLLVFMGGLSLWIYIILWIVIPASPCRPIFPDNSDYRA